MVKSLRTGRTPLNITQQGSLRDSGDSEPTVLNYGQNPKWDPELDECEQF